MNISRGVLMKSMRVSLVVGTVLVLVNHFGMLSGSYFNSTRIIQIVLCYVVPFGVSLYSQITTVQQKLSDPEIPFKEKSIRR